MIKINNAYYNIIKQAGYKYSKDNMGFYFDNGINKFSIIVIGNIYEFYFNKYENGIYNLIDKQVGVIDLNVILLKIIQIIQEGR